MSHEIRTPMNGIIGMTQLSLQTDLNRQQFHYMQQIEQSSQNLLNIINDILDFSKIEAGKLRIENINFNMHDVLSMLHSMLALKAQEKNLNFEVDLEQT